MNTLIQQQHNEYNRIYAADAENFSFHITKDKLTRYLRDRRLNKALNTLKQHFTITEMQLWSVLVVCGGVGGEGIYFLNKGFEDVTSSDFSESSLENATKLDYSGKLKTLLMNAEEINLPDKSYDLVIVQDGLHHLPRPPLGFTEMLRISRKGIIVIEPYESLVGNIIGTTWEKHGEVINFVYRWDKKMVEQTVKSYLLKEFKHIKVLRIWDHGLAVSKLASKLPKRFQLVLAKIIYGTLKPFSFIGNMMVSVIIK
ncbi:MAG: hypothetical protein AMXMBFR79_18160 [Chitinophagaceae bacterium]